MSPLKHLNNSSSSMSDSTDSSSDEEAFIFFEFVLHGIITNLVGVVGLVGNIVCIAVLRRPQMRRNSTNVILAALATFDALLIITSMLMLSLPAVYRYTEDPIFSFYFNEVYPYITPCVYALGLTAQTGSIYSTLGVTVERYIVVCWPLRSATICTYGKAKLGVASIVAFSILYNIPRFFEVSWEVVTITTPQNTTEQHVEVQMTSMRESKAYISIYITWMYLVFMYVLPFGGLSVLNMLMYLDVRRSNARQSTLSANEKKELRLAIMLMIVVVVFLICNILPLIVNILEAFGTSINEVTETSNLLVTVNSSVNFFIYIIFGEKFKRQLCQCLKGSACCTKIDKIWPPRTRWSGGGANGSATNVSARGMPAVISNDQLLGVTQVPSGQSSNNGSMFELNHVKRNKEEMEPFLQPGKLASQGQPF